MGRGSENEGPSLRFRTWKDWLRLWLRMQEKVSDERGKRFRFLGL